MVALVNFGGVCCDLESVWMILGNLIWLCEGFDRLAKGVPEVSANSRRSLFGVFVTDWNR